MTLAEGDTQAGTMTLSVSAVAAESPHIVRVDLISADGGALPAFGPGAHITVHVPGIGRRKYSLIETNWATGLSGNPSHYQLGVRLDAASAGGGIYMHALKVGDKVVVDPPQNDFPLRPDAGAPTLVAGGIGITPLLTMAAALKAQGKPFRMVYAARTRAELAFLPLVQSMTGGAAVIHADDEAGGFLDLEPHLAATAEGGRVYICGPRPMLKAAMAVAKKLGWPRDRLAFELFYSVAAGPEDAAAIPPAPAPAAAQASSPAQSSTAPLSAATGDGSFEVVVKSTGKSYIVPPDKTIVDVLEAAGVDIMHDCKKGECGVCSVGVIEGTPDHRDFILSEAEKAANKSMQICISRAKSPRLVLDL